MFAPLPRLVRLEYQLKLITSKNPRYYVTQSSTMVNCNPVHIVCTIVVTSQDTMRVRRGFMKIGLKLGKTLVNLVKSLVKAFPKLKNH